MRVKVCGITQQEQLEMLPEVGATFAGLIFYPKSPRYVLRNMTTSQLKKKTISIR
jgi:phosphoribosylanthranilate isomerase